MHSMKIGTEMGSMVVRIVFIMFLSLSFWTGSASAETDLAATRQVYDSIHSHLDPGGNLMLIVNAEGVITEFIDNITGMLSIIHDDEVDAETIADIIPKIKDFLDTHGLLALQGLGISMAPREDGLSNFKMMIARDAAAARKSFWRATVGTSPSEMKSHSYLPSDTVLVSSGTGELGALWELILSGIRDIGGEEASAQFDETVATFAVMTGITLNDLIGSIGAEGVLSLQLSSTAEVALSPETPITIPAPSVLLVLSVRDGKLIETVRNVFVGQFGMALPETIVGDATIYNIPFPIPAPVPVQITLAAHGDYVLIGSTAEVITQALDAAMNNNGLTAGDEFRQAFPDLDHNNGIRFVSRRLGETISRAYVQGMEQQAAEMQMSAEAATGLSEWMARNLETYTALVIYNRRAGIQTAGITSATGRELIGSALMAPVGMLAAIAIPSFMKSREVSASNSCVNNLRQLESAKEQAAMMMGVGDGAELPEDTVYEFIRGGKPTCPNGGEYTLNPVGQNAMCSHPGHALGW